MMNPEYDFADENEVTNEKQADEQSTGDHEDSDGEGIQGPPPQPSSKDCWRCGLGISRNWEQWLTVKRLHRKTSPGSKHNDFGKQWKPRQPLNKPRVD